MPQATRPNIVVVLIDTLRADHLSCYGYDRRTSPSLDRIAEQGRLYENAISAAAWTPPAHASLFTGTLPSRHGVTRSRLVLDPKLVPIPEILKQYGYRTFGVSNNYWLSRETRFDRGFDEFFHGWQLVQTTGDNAPLRRQQERGKEDLGLERLSGQPGGGDGRRGELLNRLFDRATRKLLLRFRAYDDGGWRVNRIARRWLPTWQASEQPFFAFLHYMEPHIRYRAPGSYYRMHLAKDLTDRRIGRVNQNPWRYVVGAKEMDAEDLAILRGLYDGEVSYVDRRVGELFALWKQAGLLDNTIVIITSDHGENLGEHHLMDHQYCLYDTLLRVPLIVHFPSVFGRGERATEQVQTIDLFPTLLELAGIRKDGGELGEKAWAQLQGQTLLSNGANGAERFALSEYLEPQPSIEVLKAKYPDCDVSRFDRILRSVRTADRKYVWASNGEHELYDLRSDPHEERNLVATDAAEAERLQGELDRRLGSLDDAHTGSQDVELDPLTRERLRDLGYLA